MVVGTSITKSAKSTDLSLVTTSVVDDELTLDFQDDQYGTAVITGANTGLGFETAKALADKGVGILMISSDMEEVIGVSDRVAVMRAGEITGILSADELTEHGILSLAVE